MNLGEPEPRLGQQKATGMFETNCDSDGLFARRSRPGGCDELQLGQPVNCACVGTN